MQMTNKIRNRYDIKVRKLAYPEPPNFADQHQISLRNIRYIFKITGYIRFKRIITCGDDCRDVPTNLLKKTDF